LKSKGPYPNNHQNITDKKWPPVANNIPEKIHAEKDKKLDLSRVPNTASSDRYKIFK